jgi:hypothetical protein
VGPADRPHRELRRNSNLLGTTQVQSFGGRRLSVSPSLATAEPDCARFEPTWIQRAHSNVKSLPSEEARPQAERLAPSRTNRQMSSMNCSVSPSFQMRKRM